MREVRGGVATVKRASEVLKNVESGLGRDLELGQREELNGLARELERSLGVFDDVMEQYGCSICGELFRGPSR